MKSKCLTLLLAGLLALSLCACGGTTAQTGTADIDALRTAMLDAAPADLPEMLLLDSSAADGAEKFPYLSSFPYDKVDSFVLCYSADGKLADEIAVIQVKDKADLDAAAESLRAHREERLKLYQTYGPDQAARVEDAYLTTQGNCAALIICDNAIAVENAFITYLDNAAKEE